MRCLKRNKRLLYVCNKDEDNGIEKYKEPIPVKINYQPTNSDSDLIALGENYPMHMRIKADLKYENVFNPGDRVYINITPAEPFDNLCTDANYEVVNEPLATLNAIEITLSKLSGKTWQ